MGEPPTDKDIRYARSLPRIGRQSRLDIVSMRRGPLMNNGAPSFSGGYKYSIILAVFAINGMYNS